MKFETEFALNYPGVVHADERSFPRGWVGPNIFGEYFKPVSAVHNAETNKTRVVFEFFRNPR